MIVFTEFAIVLIVCNFVADHHVEIYGLWFLSQKLLHIPAFVFLLMARLQKEKKQDKSKSTDKEIEKTVGVRGDESPAPAPAAESTQDTPKVTSATRKPTETEIHSKTTLFVSTIPYDANAEELESFFSTVGPVKFCFIVKDKATGKSTGCGYVRYVMADDAERALQELKKLKFQDKRQLKIKLALKKNVVTERKTAGISLNDTKTLKAVQLEKLKKSVKVVPSEPNKNYNAWKRGPNCILISKMLPGLSKNVIYKKVRKFGTVKELVVANSDNGLSENSCKAVYATHEEAKNAVEHLNDHIFKGTTIKCQLFDNPSEASLAKKSRLIIRNLSFKCQKSHLKKVFEVYGELVDFQVPFMPDGKCRGIGFVQFKDLEDAKIAVESVNGKDILGRPVAVDWALSKAEYDRLNAQDEESEAEGDVAAESNIANEPVIEEISDENKEEAIILAKNDVNLSDSEDDVDNAQSKTIFVRNLGFETTKATLQQSYSLLTRFEVFGPVKYALITKDKTTGISKGSGFVCFEETAGLSDCLKEFEKVQKLKAEAQIAEKKEKHPKSIVETVYPEAVLKKMEKFKIDGRFVILSTVVSRSVASKLTHESYFNRKERDKRNLYLMKEGVIFPDTEAANTLSTEELEHRTEQYANRKRLLASNPNLFISKTRLSIRGLHTGVTTNILKRAAIDSVNGFWTDVQQHLRDDLEREVLDEEKALGFVPSPDRKIKIVQSKIISDQQKIDPRTKKPKSKGYGFVEFGSHADALRCLRYMNNNAQIFMKSLPKDLIEAKGEKKVKRPIVEFAVENRLVLKKREDRKNQENSHDIEKDETEKPPISKKTKRKSITDSERSAKRSKNILKPVNAENQLKNNKDSMDGGATSCKSNHSLKTTTEYNNSIDAKFGKNITQDSTKQVVSAKSNKSKKTNEDEERFQNIINAYKRKIVSVDAGQQIKKSKWYS